MKLHCEHRISKSAEDLWQVLHTPEFEARLGKAIGLSEYVEIERSEDEKSIYRRIRVVPAVPPAFMFLLRHLQAGDTIRYIEHQWRSKSAMEVRWEMQPSILADRAEIKGVIRIVPVDARTCVRILDGHVDVRLFGLRSMIEQAVVASTVDAYDKSAVAAGASVPRQRHRRR